MKTPLQGSIVRLTWAAVAAAVGLALPTSARADAMRYTVTDLGAGSYANGMNNLGQVVGEQNPLSPDPQPFLYNGGTKTLLGTTSVAMAINDSGQLAQADPKLTLADPIPHYVPSAINASGTTAGAIFEAYDSHPAIGTAQGYAAIPGLQVSGLAIGINNSGQVVGWTNDDPSDATQTHAFLYSAGKVTNLGAVVGEGSMAFAINNLGQIVGQATDPATGNPFPFLYSGGKLINLGSLAGGYGSATGINDLGQVIGFSLIPSGDGAPSHAFLYQNGIMTDLTKLLKTDYGIDFDDQSGAFQINNRGQLLIDTHDSVGMSRAYLLTPETVPEPTTIASFACAGVALAWQRRKVGHRARQI